MLSWLGNTNCRWSQDGGALGRVRDYWLVKYILLNLISVSVSRWRQFLFFFFFKEWSQFLNLVGWYESQKKYPKFPRDASSKWDSGVSPIYIQLELHLIYIRYRHSPVANPHQYYDSFSNNLYKVQNLDSIFSFQFRSRKWVPLYIPLFLSLNHMRAETVRNCLGNYDRSSKTTPPYSLHYCFCLFSCALINVYIT